jgi:Flp pilus assembly secretin CpaC
MKTLAICLLLALSSTVCGQESGGEQPDTTGERLKQLLRSADEMEHAGQSERAAQLREKAGRERQALLSHIDSLQAEVERLGRIAGGAQQVMVHLKVFEVSLTKLRRLGYNLAKMQGKRLDSPDAANNSIVGGFSVVDDGTEAARFFESLRKDNLAKVIAEPTLTTISGSKAVFHTGGKFPVQKQQADGVAIKWEQIGTMVELTPRTYGDRRVRLSIHFRAADLDHANGTQVGKQSVPGIRVREFTANAELGEGQTLAFSGLNQVHVETTESSVPIASSIPYVGAAFRSVKEERNETAMFVLVRPELVQPVDNAPATAHQPSDIETRR